MKQLKNRTVFVLAFAVALVAGLVLFLGLYVVQGGDWAAFSANRHAYTNGRLTSGALYDRNGDLLYDCETQSYGGDKLTRKSLLHVIGDREGNISTGALRTFSTELLGYSPLFGTSGQGNDVTLTVDAGLNRTAYEALNGRNGVVALYNYQTGEVLTLVSAPAYDPDSSKEVAAVAAGDSDYAGAYLNHLFNAVYTPGSTFKLVTAAAALEVLGTEFMDDYTYTCTGSVTIEGTVLNCSGVHGTQTFGECLTNSCNAAFADLALRLGGDTLRDYTERAGLLSSMTVDGIATAAGSFDASADGTVELGWSGVGQSTNLVNPCAELALMGCIANGGTAPKPELLQSVTTSLGIPVGAGKGGTLSIGWDEATCDRLRWMMRDNVTDNYEDFLNFGDLQVCAKSGTAEVGDGDPHAWFVGFVDSDAYPYAFVVVVEHGGSGASVAGRVAATLLRAACGS